MNPERILDSLFIKLAAAVPQLNNDSYWSIERVSRFGLVVGIIGLGLAIAGLVSTTNAVRTGKWIRVEDSALLITGAMLCNITSNILSTIVMLQPELLVWPYDLFAKQRLAFIIVIVVIAAWVALQSWEPVLNLGWGTRVRFNRPVVSVRRRVTATRTRSGARSAS